MPTRDGKAPKEERDKKKILFLASLPSATTAVPAPKPFCEEKDHRWEYWQMGDAKCSVCDKCVPALVAMRTMQFYLDQKNDAFDKIVVMIDNYFARKL